MIYPIKPIIGLRISLNMNYRYYSLETPKRHCRCNHTRVLLCRILCANQGCSGVGTAFPHLFSQDYIKTWLRSYRCASDTKICNAQSNVYSETGRSSVEIRV